MADKFYAEPGAVTKLRNALYLKQTAFDGVSDRIVRDMEAGKPVSRRKAIQVARNLEVAVETLAADRSSDSGGSSVPVIDIRLDNVQTSYVSPAYPVAAPQLAAIMEDSRNCRFLTYGHIDIPDTVKDAFKGLENAIEGLRANQLSGKRTVMVAETISQLLDQQSGTQEIESGINALRDLGIAVLATNVVNQDWYQYFDPFEDSLFEDADPSDFRRLLTWEVTIIIFTTMDADCINVLASHRSKSSEPVISEEDLDDDIPF